MPFNIDRFKANIEESGYIKTNSFGILISPPAILQNSQILNGGFSNPVNNVTNDLLFRVSELSTPATALNVADINRYGVGPTQKFPLNSVFNNLTLGILCDQYGDIWRFWYNWLNSIFEFTGKTDVATGNVNTLPAYGAEYKSNYATMASLLIYDPEGNEIQRFDMTDVFPTSMLDVGLDWGSSELIKLKITITFKDFTIVGSDTETPVIYQEFGQPLPPIISPPISTR